MNGRQTAAGIYLFDFFSARAMAASTTFSMRRARASGER